MSLSIANHMSLIGLVDCDAHPYATYSNSAVIGKRTVYVIREWLRHNPNTYDETRYYRFTIFIGDSDGRFTRYGIMSSKDADMNDIGKVNDRVKNLIKRKLGL